MVAQFKIKKLPSGTLKTFLVPDYDIKGRTRIQVAYPYYVPEGINGGRDLMDMPGSRTRTDVRLWSMI